MLAKEIVQPLHLGITEAGGLRSGTVKSAVGLVQRLQRCGQQGVAEGDAHRIAAQSGHAQARIVLVQLEVQALVGGQVLRRVGWRGVGQAIHAQGQQQRGRAARIRAIQVAGLDFRPGGQAQQAIRVAQRGGGLVQRTRVAGRRRLERRDGGVAEQVLPAQGQRRMAAHAHVGIVGGGRQAGRRIGRRRIEQGERQSLAVVAQVAQRLAVVVIGQGRGRIAPAVSFAIVAAVAVVRMVLRSEGQAIGAGQEVRVGAQAGRQRVVQRRQGRLRIELLLLRRGIGRQHGHAVVASLELERQVARRQGRLRIEGQAVDVEHGAIGVQAFGGGRA
ncbi:4-hydroxy-3-methylbut-2-en-1-yl diphosphate synthase [compost metagenome]